MSLPRATIVLTGQVVVSISADGLQTTEAIGVADGHVVAVGSRDEVLETAAPGARMVAAGKAAIVPGIHDFHLHLVGMARARRAVALRDVAGFEALLAELRRASSRLVPGLWLGGWGWREELLSGADLARLDEAVGERRALLYSRDSHSAWASAAALRVAGIGRNTPDPPGGRIERRAEGAPNGILRESATDLVDVVAERVRGPALDAALDEVLAELAGLGITGATDAGDTSVESGVGEYAALGDSASLLLGARARLDGRIRLTVNVPAAAIGPASKLGMQTGAPLPGSSSIRAGWAKAYVDGALGSRTAALHAPYLGATGELGIVRLAPDELDRLLAAGRATGIGLALHAIGDRAVTLALDAFGRAPARGIGTPPDRIEHAQLVRAEDLRRFAELRITASLQPVHVVSD
ncbi:MAG: amidohydrolase, partial [Candidatus Limnocylindria bacterium]